MTEAQPAGRSHGASQASGGAVGLVAAAPIMGVVFVSFLVIGMALPALPLHVHDVLGFGPTVVGLVAGGQFVAALVTRYWAGRLADTRGAKRAVTLGLCTAIAGGAAYLASILVLARPVPSVGLLLVGRTLLGGAESLVVTGGMLWALERVPSDQSAKMMAWVGMSMFAALAVGAPLGAALYGSSGFTGIAAATIALSITPLFIVIPMSGPIPKAERAGSIRDVLRPVLLPGVAFALSGITNGAITAFLTLYFALQGWSHGAVAFTVFAVALIAARLLGGHLPDKHGGARVALWSLLVQIAGLVTIGLATSGMAAMAGAALAGVGFSLVFPGLGLEAITRVPPERRGLAMGTYNAFFDVTLGFGSPALGSLAARSGVGSIFIASAICAVAAIPIVLVILRQNAAPDTQA